MISLTTSVHGVEDLNVTKGQLLLEHPAYLRLAGFVCRLGGNGWAPTVTTKGLSIRITQNQIPSRLKAYQKESPKIKDRHDLRSVKQITQKQMLSNV